MTATNRALNRALLIIVGVVLIGISASLFALVASAMWRSEWKSRSQDLQNAANAAFGDHLWAGTSLSGSSLIALAGAAVFVALLIIFILRQGGGRTRDILQLHSDSGRVTVNTDVIDTLVADALSSHPEVIKTSVTSYRVRGQSVLKITLRARRGASPRRLVDEIDRVTGRLHHAFGNPLPVFVELIGGSQPVARVSAHSRDHGALPGKGTVGHNHQLSSPAQ